EAKSLSFLPSEVCFRSASLALGCLKTPHLFRLGRREDTRENIIQLVFELSTLAVLPPLASAFGAVAIDHGHERSCRCERPSPPFPPVLRTGRGLWIVAPPYLFP